MVTLLLLALGSALVVSLNATTKKSYTAHIVGNVTLIVVSVVVPPLCVTLLPDTA